MQAREFTGEVRDGKLPVNLQKAIAGLLRLMEGKRIVITIREFQARRSLSQNAYWFAVLNKHVVPVYRESGSNWDDKDIHDDLMKQLGYMEMMERPDGSMASQRMHSSKFTTKQWEEYMERARVYLADFGIFVPLPNEEQMNYWLSQQGE